MSCKDAQQRCWIADKQLVSDVIMGDVVSITPVQSRVDELLHQAEREEHAMSDVLSGLVTRRLSLAL